MAIPVEWLGNFQVNTGAAAAGGQGDTHVIGLSNGNILVAWVESAGGAIGATAGTDIIGKIYDAEGNLVRDSYRLNTSFTADDELDFNVAATNDGGFVMVYVDDDISNPAQTSIRWERFDAAGGQIDSATIDDEIVTTKFLVNPQVTVDLTNNLSFVSYTDDVGNDNTGVRGRTVTAAGVVGTRFDAAINDFGPCSAADVAVLSNGNFVTAYKWRNGGVDRIQFRIQEADGSVIVSNAVVTATLADAEQPKVASLAGGGFVVIWESDSDSNEFVIYEIFDRG